jgi:hypothetical protein
VICKKIWLSNFISGWMTLIDAKMANILGISEVWINNGVYGQGVEMTSLDFKTETSGLSPGVLVLLSNLMTLKISLFSFEILAKD